VNLHFHRINIKLSLTEPPAYSCVRAF
jgi:hypothetical protein